MVSDSISIKKTLSANIAETILFLYFSTIAALTIATLFSQILGISFQSYAIISLIVSIITGSAIVFNATTRNREHLLMDKTILIGLILAGIASCAIALSYHRVGRIAVDEFYATANPTYYLKEPNQPMGFETRAFYSGGKPFYSVAFLTAGAYEYLLAVLSFFTHISYLRIYYQLAAGLAAFLLPATIYLLLMHFSSGDSLPSFLGTLAVICVEIVTAESAATPGGFAFIRIFEGKSIMLALGIPLFTSYALDFLQSRKLHHWFKLFLLITALCGMTTTSFMILPILGVIILVAYLITYRHDYTSKKLIIRIVALFFSSYAYLIPYMALVALRDGAANAIAFNESYPATFAGYLGFFGSLAMPTPASAILFTLGALVFTRGARRTFLAWWIVLAIVFALNPLMGDLLISLFRGIFYRLFYILPFPVSAGILVSNLSTRISGIKKIISRSLAYGFIILAPILMTLTIPSSIFRSQIYAPGGWSQHEEYLIAEKIIDKIPQGLMLCPYPTSGAIRMLSVDYPQMITREDMVQYYLDTQDRETEAKLRLQTDHFLAGSLQDPGAMTQLLDQYPEIESVVLDRAVYSKIDSSQLNAILASRGYVNKGTTGEYIFFWK